MRIFAWVVPQGRGVKMAVGLSNMVTYIVLTAIVWETLDSIIGYIVKTARCRCKLQVSKFTATSRSLLRWHGFLGFIFS